MKTFLITVATLLFTANLYTTVKVLAYNELAMVPYVNALNAQIQCNHKVVIDNRLPILERVLHMPLAVPVEQDRFSEVTEACDKAEKRWSEFAVSLEKYKSHQWGQVHVFGGAKK